MSNKHNHMTELKRKEYIFHIKSLLKLGVPIIIGQLGNIVTGLADTVMVGQHSTQELAAASFVNNVINAFIILGTGLLVQLHAHNRREHRGQQAHRHRRVAEEQPHGQLHHHADDTSSA